MSHLITLAALSFLDVPLAALLPLALAPMVVVWHALHLLKKAGRSDPEADL